MHDDVRPLKVAEVPREPNAALVELLEDVLSRARAGQFTSGAVVFTLMGGDAFTGYTDTDQGMLLLGAMRRLEHQFQLDCDESTSSPDDEPPR